MAACTFFGHRDCYRLNEDMQQRKIEDLIAQGEEGMKRMICTSIVLIMLLTGCSAPAQQVPPITEPNGNDTYGVYELDFDVERLSGCPFEGWDVAYTHNDEVIESGHQVLLSVGIFTFYSVQVDVTERGDPKNTFTATFPVAICDGGTGKTQITVTDSNGKTTTFKVTCEVAQVGKR